MARYHIGFTTVAAAAGAAYADLKAGAADRVRILEIGIFNTAATSSIVELQRETTVGNQTTTIVPAPGDTADGAAASVVATAWTTTLPASTAVPMRSVQLPGTSGLGLSGRSATAT